MATLFVKMNEATAARRRVYFYCVDATDGMTPETGEASGQPQCSLDGESFTNTGIGVLTHMGNGQYYADLTQAKVNVANGVIKTRYKSANTAEAVGDTVIVGLPSLILQADLGDGNNEGTAQERTVRSALRAIRNKATISGGVLTVTTENDSTTAWTAAVTGTAGADPITAIDPT
jgi:hypothetical protein